MRTLAVRVAPQDDQVEEVEAHNRVPHVASTEIIEADVLQLVEER